jgi:outer membrane protein OmpA-like peptidoglycan-associated protein
MNYAFKNMKTICIAGVFSMVALVANAQSGENLLSNGGFESTDGKVKKLAGIESANGWTSPTGVRADIFTPSKVAEINTPENVYGKEAAKEGSNYAGIVAYSFGDKVPRSYLMTRFDAPLKKGMKYCVQFHVSLAEASKYSANNIGANISKKPFATDTKTAIIDKTHIVHYNNKVFNATYNWEKVCGVYEAEGGEKYITIGNFSMNDKMKYETNKKPKDMKVTQVVAAYYYIDDISVRLINQNDECDCMLTESSEEYTTTIFQKSIALNEKMTAKEKIEAQQVFFAFGKTALTPIAEESLELILAEMKANPTMKLEIKGFCNPEENKVAEEKPVYADMDSRRVNMVLNYLIDNGIAESRLIASPQGDSTPSEEIMADDDDDLKMAKSRRIEFKVR